MKFQIGKKYTHVNWPAAAYFIIDKIVNSDVCATYYAAGGYTRESRHRMDEFNNFEDWVLVIDFEQELEQL